MKSHSLEQMPKKQTNRWIGENPRIAHSSMQKHKTEEGPVSNGA